PEHGEAWTTFVIVIASASSDGTDFRAANYLFTWRPPSENLGAFRLDVQSPRNVHGIEIGLDPEPNWSFDDILLELNLLESKFSSSPLLLRPPDKASPKGNFQDNRRNNIEKGFVVRVSDDDFDYLDSDDETQTVDQSIILANGYAYPDMYLSDTDSEEEIRLQIQAVPLEKMGVVEGALLEMSHEYHLYVKEEVRSHISSLETELLAEKEKSASAQDRLQKITQARRDMDRKLDMHYQRKMAEVLDDHLTSVQRDHEHKSQKAEREISDAAAEEARRKEKAFQEEKTRQLRAKAVEEAKQEAERKAEEARRTEEVRKAVEARRADEAKIAAVDAERKATQKDSSSIAQKVHSTGLGSDGQKKVQSSGSIIRAAESAIKLEVSRLQNLKELDKKNQMSISSADKEYVKYKREIARHVKTTRGTIDNVRTKASELVRMLNNHSCPQSVTAAILAKEVISVCEAPNGDSFVFACAHVIVLVSAQVPLVMDLVLAEFHRACIYTVPKHIMYSESAFETKEAYYKSIGYRVEDGELEKTENYVTRLQSYMKLYGALVQTEIQGVKNLHGIEEGWRWLARFLNALPPNRYTVVALEAFLTMAGFALHGKYRSQFMKILNAISQDYLVKFKGRADSKDNSLIIYNLESRKFLQEPEGRRLHGALLSRTCVPGEEYQQNGYGNSYRGNY
ncbi:hypothetical protein V2J09_013157, partial [Rumex salicifolius]